MRIIIGLIMIAAGFGMIWKTEWLVSNFGRIAFFENYLGTEGGTRLGLKLIGILVIFIGFLLVSGMYENFANTFFGPLLRVITPQ
jgi:uncharacterized membrane protein (DUF485 family)